MSLTFEQILHIILLFLLLTLTHQVPVLPPYRNQSINLHSKSIDWFLHEGNTGT